MKTKKCSKCGEVKGLNEFTNEKRSIDGHYYYCKKCMRENYAKNREKILAEQKERYKNDSDFKLSHVLRVRISSAIKNQYSKKTFLSMELLGCTIQECRDHLEKQFKPGMSWKNHGHRGWHINHIIPCASFDLTNPEEQKKCFHYTNLQPLWAVENIRKSKKLPV